MARKGLYTQTFTLPNGKRKYVTAKTKEELDEKVFQLKLQLRLGIDLDDRTTVGELLQIWFDAEQKGRVRDTSAGTTKSLINNHILPQLSGLRVKDVTPLVIQNYLLTLSGLCRGMSSRCLSILRGAFNLAVENKLIASSPVLPRFKAPGKVNAPRRALDIEQQKLLLDALPYEEPAWLFARIGLFCGLRAGEILGLRWDAVDLNNQVIQVRRSVVYYNGHDGTLQEQLKTRTSRRDVPIPDDLTAELRKRKASATSLFLFPGKTGGIPERYMLDRIRYVLRTAQTGTLVTPHILRHTYATRLFEAGLDVTEVQRLLGHSTPTTTMQVYVDYCDSRRDTTFSRARNALSECTTSVSECTTPVPQRVSNGGYESPL